MPMQGGRTKNYEYVRFGIPHSWIEAVRDAKWSLRKPYGEVLRHAIGLGLIQLGLVDNVSPAPFAGAEPVLVLDPKTKRLRLAGWSGDL